MSTLEELPPDQRAALSLLLAQRKSYAELAQVLGIPEQAVHDRAHAALAVLAPRQAREVPAERREEIGDYLLGQQRGVAERLATRTYLGDDEPARVWAQQLAGQLAPLAGAALPDIPAAAGRPAAANGAAPQGPAQSTAAPPPAGSPPAGGGQPSSPLPSSRLGGALLLGGILAGVIVAVILLSGGGGGTHARSTSASSTAASGGKSAASGGGPKVDQRLTLKSPSSSSAAIALVEILSEGGKRAFYMAAEHLPPTRGFYYAIWLYNSPSSFEPLSKSPAVGSNERLAGGALLPANAGSFHEMLVTRETASKPSRPGPTVLSGPFSLGG